jgi:hypothetical protein
MRRSSSRLLSRAAPDPRSERDYQLIDNGDADGCHSPATYVIASTPLRLASRVERSQALAEWRARTVSGERTGNESEPHSDKGAAAQEKRDVKPSTCGDRRSIIDDYADVLQVLRPDRRRGFIAELAVGYYEGWRPDRAEIIDLVALELGRLTVEEFGRRRQLRKRGYRIPELNVFRAPPVRSWPSHRISSPFGRYDHP